MAPVATAFSQWRSPPPVSNRSLDPIDLPGSSSPAATKADLLHPSFLPPCEHAKDGGEMHAHAFDLLSLSASPASKSAALEPSSVPAASILSNTRPANGAPATASNGPPKARRMSSSTTGVLGRGKLGLTGDAGLVSQVRPSLSHANSSASPIPTNRRLSSAAPGSSPQLFDFAKTDRRPSAPNARPKAVAGSLPARGIAGAAPRVQPAPAVADDMELDMEFDGDDDDDRSGGRSGSAELEMDMDDDGEIKGEQPDWEKLALGTGSGGIKGRRKGMVFKCESCSKEYRHPSCLIKHRWEHSPHWREPTQISMSKHQQVQLLEAAAILAHMDPTNAQGRSLPTDKSLWPAILSSPGSARSNTRELPALRSPQSTAPPLTPSSLRESVIFGKDRKSSPGSDSTSDASYGASPRPNGQARPMGIADPGRRTSASSVPGPITPHSIGSLPDMNGLHFHTGSTPTAGTSPLPNRGVPLSLTARASMIGGGMFGARSSSLVKMPDSSVRGGANDDDDDELEFGLSGRHRGKSSSEEAEDRRREDEGFEIGVMEL